MQQRTPKFDTGPEGPCICTQLRRAARRVSASYDRFLQPAGISVNQYAVLVNIGRAGEIGRSALAAALGMDRTTLTRNLAPLERMGLVTGAKNADRRARWIRLSPAGLRKTKKAYGLWHNAQRAFAADLGAKKVERLRFALAAAEVTASGV